MIAKEIFPETSDVGRKEAFDPFKPLCQLRSINHSKKVLYILGSSSGKDLVKVEVKFRRNLKIECRPLL